MKAIPLLLVGTLLPFHGAASPLASDLSLQQLNHRAFTYIEGAPSNIFALAQTSDGTLWIGGGSGLTRFDGIRFVPYPGPSEDLLPDTGVTSLTASRDGGLWIGFDSGGVSFLKSGHVISYGPDVDAPDDTVYQFSWDRGGGLWVASLNGLSRFKDERWEKISGEAGFTTVVGVLVDRADTVWVATGSGLFARDLGEVRFRKVDDRAFYYGTSGIVLASDSDGTVWGATPNELLRIGSSGGSRQSGVNTVRGISGGPIQFDSRGNLWGAHASSSTLARISSRELIPKDQSVTLVQPEEFSRTDGLSRGRVQAILEDREQNVWIGTTTGLERFRYGNVRREFAACDSGAIAAGDAGTIWMACYSGTDSQTAEIREIKNADVISRQAAPPFTIAYRDREGTVWFGGEASLGRLEQGKLFNMPLPSDLQGRFVSAMVRDATGAMWISMYDEDVVRFVDGVWSERGNLEELPRGTMVSVASADESGVIWFGYPDNRVARVSGDRVQLFGSSDGLAVGKVQSILAQDNEVWIGGELGLSRFNGERFITVQNATTTSFKGISGIVRVGNGDIWLHGAFGIALIPHREVENFVRSPAHRVVSETFNHLDGVPGPAVLFGALPTAILGTDERVWFLTVGGVVSIDATRLVRNKVAPPVTIWSLSSGSNRYTDLNPGLTLPIKTTNVQIEYTAGSLTVPERVNFRYKLEGSDSDWQEAGTRREANYTNLRPGDYTFRVIASNNDGIWNETSASMHFFIPPAFYQTRWFHVLLTVALAAIGAAIYRVRVRQVAAQVRGRLEARLGERERIARELHDTLLQGMQGLIWRFQAAAERIAPGEPAREMMDLSLDRADKLLEESRDKVKDLRPVASVDFDLAQVLAVAGAELAQGNLAEFRVNEQGTRRTLHPIAREEVILIGREALSNAFRHSGATHIEIDVTYGATALQIRIRDDGQGIDADIIDAGGKPGHFGLVGIRERAKKLGAHLQFWTKPGAGTEVDIRVPADVAYPRQDKASDGTRSWLSNLPSR